MNLTKAFSSLILVSGMLLLSPAFSQSVGTNVTNPGNKPPGNNPPGTGQPGQPGNNPPGVPVDGGATFLAAAGAIYGLKKYKDYRKKQKEINEEAGYFQPQELRLE